jgi:glycine/D-amino acid oxidase-like deaminating enzyme
VVTEKGTIKTKTAILAGGAWASSFCKQLGIRFPQASVRSSVLSVSPGTVDLPDALHTADVTVTSRGDGGFTLAISGRGRVDPTAQQIRFSPQFLPMFLKRWRSLLPGTLEGVRSGHETLRTWRLDQPTPMERMRILDPVPDRGAIKLTFERAKALLPSLETSSISAAWAGYIDSTPDGVPGIGEASSVPGFILAAGFSGHGFGIGPGAGRLIADIVTGAANPIVDPKPYHFERFEKSTWGKVAEF